MKSLCKLAFIAAISMAMTQITVADPMLAFNLVTNFEGIAAACPHQKFHPSFDQCGPQTYTVDNDTIIGEYISPVIIYNNTTMVCKVNVFSRKTCAHGGCGYQVHVQNVIAAPGYNCVATKDSTVTLSQSSH